MMILLLVLTILLNCVVVNAHRYAVHDHPVHPYFDEELEEETAEARHRRLSTFVPIETRFTDQAYESTIGNLRVKFVWDLLDDAIQDTTTTQAEQMDPSVCREVGQTVDVCRYERSFGSSCSQSCQSLTCTQSDVLTAEKLAIAKEHAQWAADYLSESLFVTKVESPIDFSGEDSAKRCYNWDKGNSSLNTNSSFIHSATDVVVVMTMHKAPDGVAGYASCGMYDGTSRCLVGHFNWCPNQVDVDNKEDSNVIQNERSTFLHELLHVLGCCSGSMFIDNTGARITGSNLPYSDVNYNTGSDGYSKTVRMFDSPKVLKTVKSQWDCDSLQGVPLEDVPLGAGSHWEARVLGPEVMAYGTSSGEPYMSDLTFAYLEDSGHFVAARNYINGDRYTANNNAYLDNYTYAKGGRFLEATGAGISVGGLSKIAEFFGWTYSRESRESYLRTPGQLRWGAKKGCDFFQKKASISWPDSYVCKTNANAGCTADNRMSARCSVKEWSSVESRYSCLSSGNCPNVNSESPNLPSEYRHIDGSATAGGYNNAMDYVPVRVGYWSCLDKKPLTASSQGVAGNQSVDFSGLFNSLSADLENFGGQQYGTEARCFESTLREFGSVLSLTFDTYGLCYAANCYTADYLQIGIRGRDGGTEWYHCPSGKTLYLAGFSGSVQCPNTIEFCDHEDITGVFMTETQIWAAWVIIGVIVGIPLIIIIIICCCPKIRHKVVIATKNCCGVELDPDEQLIYERSKARKALRRQRRVGIASSNTTRQLAAIDTRAMAAFKIKVNRAFQKRARCETRLLFYINLFWSIVGFFCLLLGLCAASGFPAGMQNTAPLLIVSAIFITAISSCGCSNINTGRPSLKLLVYFYIALFSGVGCLLMGVAMLFFSDYSDDTLESNWFSLRLYFPESYQDLTLEEAQDQFEDDFGFDWNYTLYGGYGILSFSTTVGALSAAYVLTWNNLMQNIFLIFNALFILSFGIVMLTLGVSLLDIDLLEKLQTVMIILVGLLYLISFASGIIGDWFKNDKCLKVYQIFALVSAISGYTFSILIYTSESTIRDNVNALDDEDKAIAAETLSLESTTSEELADLIVGTFKLYGLISIIDSTILLVLALLSRYIIRFHEARTKKLSDWAKRCARAEELGLSRPIAPDVSFLGLVRHISQRDALGSQLNNNNPIIQNRSDIELAHDHAIPVVQARDVDQLPQACAIELADLPDGMEFPGPPPDVPQGQDSPHNLLAEVAVPVYRPEPVPPVRSQPVLEEKEEEEEEEEEEEKQGDDCVDIESI